MNELFHHGILGQRWGIRRYQNKDGTLTSLGRKRLNQLSEAAAKTDNNKHRKSRHSDNSRYRVRSSKKNAEDQDESLTDEELQKRINRLRLEQQYSSLKNGQGNSSGNNQNASDMQSRINQLRLEKEYRSLMADLTPKEQTRSEYLKDRISTLKLEKEYCQLVEEMAPVTKGQKVKTFLGGIAKESIEKAGKEVGAQVASYLLGNAVNKLSGKEIVKSKDKKDDKKDDKKGGKSDYYNSLKDKYDTLKLEMDYEKLKREANKTSGTSKEEKKDKK